MSRILLVDDSRDLRETLSTLLALKGYSVSVANEHENLIEQIHINKPDVVLLHVGMAAEDGREGCRKIYKEFGKEPPVILTSGNEELLWDFEEYGAVDFLEKPYELPLLLQKLENVLCKP